MVQKEWNKRENSEFEEWLVYDELPEIFKKNITYVAGWKSGPEVEEILKSFTEGVRYKYGVGKWADRRTNQLPLWRVKMSEQAPSSSGTTSGGAQYQKRSEVVIDVDECSLEMAKVTLAENEKAQWFDPKWRIKEVKTLRERHEADHSLEGVTNKDATETEKLVYILEKVKKI